MKRAINVKREADKALKITTSGFDQLPTRTCGLQVEKKNGQESFTISSFF
jgi:hypothetical protein